MPQTTSVSTGQTDSGLPFVRTPARKDAPFLEADAERLALAHGLRPATAQEGREVREAIARMNAQIAKQAAQGDFARCPTIAAQ